VKWGDRVPLARRLLPPAEMPAGSPHDVDASLLPKPRGTVELDARNPEPGALSWRLRVDGRIVDEQHQTLEEPLEKGHAFFLQAGFDEYANGQLAAGW
jgi:hypothetical protein